MEKTENTGYFWHTVSIQSPLEAACILHSNEYEHMESLPPRRALHYTAGRFALKQLLGCPKEEMPVMEVATSAEGKPYCLAFPDLFCSISHDSGYAVAAVSKTSPIGVDIEEQKRRHPALLSAIASSDEIELLRGRHSTDLLSTFVWAVKEAAAKADISLHHPKEYQIEYAEPYRIRRGTYVWDVSVKALGTHILAIAELTAGTTK